MRTTLLILLFAIPGFAASPAVQKLSVSPGEITLNTPFAYAQTVVTAHFRDGTTKDVTREVKAAHGPNVSVTANGLIRPLKNGNQPVQFGFAGQTVSIPTTVQLPGEAPTVSFVQDVQPILSKLGCNSGTCHGAQQGKNGFKLSLRGYDAGYDHRALTDDLEARRFNRAAPERSLMLLKAVGEVAHVGGSLMQPGDVNYQVLRDWISQGVKLDARTPKVKSIEIEPKNPTLETIGEKQQFRVIAVYPDGRKRDVSHEAFIESSNTEAATVDKNGLMTSLRRGETTMLARYEGAYAASTVIVMGDRSGFTWTPPPGA